MRFLSLFAGIGGFDLGLERAGMQCVGQVEVDEYCNKVLSKHWPNVKRIKDIRNVKGKEFGTVELICGGFPCQPFSTAGKRHGKKDDRYLWPEMLRVIQAIRPHWILGENVVGIINLGAETVSHDLESVGYTVQMFIIPAGAIGVPHRRERVWILANSNSNRLLSIFTKEYEKKRTERVSTEWCPNWYVPELGQKGTTVFTEQWEIPPEPFRVVDGIPNQLDRIKALGNAVVPQVAEVIGRAILETENAFLNMESDNTTTNKQSKKR